MAQLNDQGQKLTIKLVYYGPALSGKTTNLMSLHDKLEAELISDLTELAIKQA